MPDDAMFAPLAAEEIAVAGAAVQKPRLTPIIPVPADAPPCRWRHRQHGAPIARWGYHDCAGRLVGYAARVEYVEAGDPKKDVYPITYCQIDGSRNAWHAHAVPAPRPLYRLPALLAAPASPVIVTEGEKKADVVPRLFPGYLGMTSMGGARAAKLSDWTPLSGRDVVIWPDHDEPGRHYAEDVAALATVAGAVSVAIVRVPAVWPEGWDLADPLPDGIGPEALAELLRSAGPWVPPAQVAPTGDNDAAEIDRLAELSELAYERERKAAAGRLGISRLSILDRLVAGARGGAASTPGQGRALSLRTPEPWPDQVNGGELLDELTEGIRRYVVLGDDEVDAAALWVLAVHAFDAWRIFPRLFITAPEKGCGKTTLLDVLSLLVPRPLAAANIKAAPLFRVIESARPTLLLDEADAYARDDEDLRSVLDAGHHRDGAVIRCVGDDHEPRQFSAWAPVALAAIGHLPATIEDRSIIIQLRRRRSDEAVGSLRLDRSDGLDKLARMAARWAVDHVAALADADPDMPDAIINRTADNWRPLLAVADLTRGDWPARARRAAIGLAVEREDDSGSIRIALLADIRAGFACCGTDRLASEELVAYLVGLDDRPWPEFRGGKPISKAQVARLLTPLHISSGTIRFEGGHTAKGYYRRAFDDAFARYLVTRNVTASQPEGPCRLEPDSETSQAGTCDVSESPRTPSISATCDVVTFWEPHPLDDNVMLFEERAAIQQYDGGISRHEAECLARAELGSSP